MDFRNPVKNAPSRQSKAKTNAAEATMAPPPIPSLVLSQAVAFTTGRPSFRQPFTSGVLGVATGAAVSVEAGGLGAGEAAETAGSGIGMTAELIGLGAGPAPVTTGVGLAQRPERL